MINYPTVKICKIEPIFPKLKYSKYSKYAIGEKVYVRLRDKGRLQKKCCVTEAVIEKRNLRRHLYKVSYTSPESGKNEKKWLAVDDITSLTLREEKNKKKSPQAFKIAKRKPPC